MSNARGHAPGPNAAYRLSRAIQLLAFLGGTAAMVMTMSVMGDPERSTAPSLGLALLSGAVFVVGWLIQRRFGRTPDRQ